MRPHVLTGALLSLLCGAALAHAAPPRSAAHVDPKAPCFRWPAVDYDGDGVFDRVDHCPGTPAGCSVNEWGCSTDADGDGVCDGVDQCPNTPAGTRVNAHGCDAHVAAGQPAPKEMPPTSTPVPSEVKPRPRPEPARPVRTEQEQKLIEKGSIRLENVTFATNSANLLPASETSLDEAGEALQKYPALMLEVQGHTDTRGSAAANLRLSQARAEAVRSYLLAHFKLDGEHLRAKGYGETQPLNGERSDEELLQNRRVVIVVLNPEALPRGVEIEK